jgi:hypothetical protein
MTPQPGRPPGAPEPRAPGTSTLRPPAPHPRSAPAAAATLTDLEHILAAYERLDNAPRHPADRLAHLDQLIERLRRHVEYGIPSRGLLVAVAAQAVSWASTLGDE